MLTVVDAAAGDVEDEAGRAAYMALKTHYLGDSFVSRIRSAADSRLDTAFTMAKLGISLLNIIVHS